MKIISESMSRPYGCGASALALVFPPAISVAVTLVLEPIIGTLICLVLFPVVYVLFIFATLCGMTYLTRIFEGKGNPDRLTDLESRVHQLEQLAGKLALENELLKKAVQQDVLTPPKKNEAFLPNSNASLKTRKGGANS